MRKYDKMKKKYIVSYEWFTEDQSILDNYSDTLELEAQERITDMQKKGYSSGELVCCIYGEDFPDDGIVISGSWSIKEVEEDEPTTREKNLIEKLKRIRNRILDDDSEEDYTLDIIDDLLKDCLTS